MEYLWREKGKSVALTDNYGLLLHSRISLKVTICKMSFTFQIMLSTFFSVKWLTSLMKQSPFKCEIFTLWFSGNIYFKNIAYIVFMHIWCLRRSAWKWFHTVLWPLWCKIRKKKITVKWSTILIFYFCTNMAWKYSWFRDYAQIYKAHKEYFVITCSAFIFCHQHLLI